MSLVEGIRSALQALVVNKLRSFLTILGIVIGVAAVVTLLSLGQGMQATVTSQFRGLGSNLIYIMPAASGGGRASLTYADAQAIAQRVPDAVDVAPALARSAEVTFGGQETTTNVSGVTPNYEAVNNFHVELGAFISQADMRSNSLVCVLGKTVVDDLALGGYPIGLTIKMEGVPFQIIGVMEEKGGFGNQDDVIFMPLTTAQTRLFRERSLTGEYEVSSISVQVASEDLMAAATEQITTLLRQRHRLAESDDDDFYLLNPTEIASTLNQVISALTIFLGAIGGISLLVGGIGVMNIMLVSVTERTREIGIRKAVGAKQRDILLQFLVEAVVLSLAGGIVGILLGYLGSKLFSRISEGLTAQITPSAILLATGFSIAVGIFFGIYPARRAARLNPIEALRYE